MSISLCAVQCAAPGGEVSVNKLAVREIDQTCQDLLRDPNLLNVRDLEICENVATVAAPHHIVAETARVMLGLKRNKVDG